MDIIKLVTDKIEELTSDSALFLVEIKIKPTNNIKVYMDGDNGVNVEACTKINRALYKMVEESGMYPEGDFSLEVSSSGVDEPLKFFRQYLKNVGRTVEVTQNDETKHLGVLQSATEEAVVLEKQIGKKKEIVSETIPFDTIKATVVQVVF